MAPNTPSRARRVAQESSSPFSSRIVHIAIGKEKEIFNIHKAKLDMTAFFAINGGLPTFAVKLQRANRVISTGAELEVNDMTVKDEGGAEKLQVGISATQCGESADDPMAVDEVSALPANLPDYYLEDRFHIPRAFRIIVKWLYNERLTEIKTRNQCGAFLQAYVLARTYEILGLQNRIIELFRTLLATHHVNFDDLIWIANRHEQDPRKCALTAYLLDQVVYEILTHGFNEFANANGYFEKFLSMGELHTLRVDMFKAIAEQAHIQAAGRNIRDPAVGQNRWLAYENGGQARR